MSDFRFKVGATVMCNLGPDGWMLGTVVALRYREAHWPAGQEAPYQVALEEDHALIYVPVDDVRYCREATSEDVRIARRKDALAALVPEDDETALREPAGAAGSPLGCAGPTQPGDAVYRTGRCHCCDCCPRRWSAVELYSEHYRCAERNGLKVTRHAVHLGRVRVGEAIARAAGDELPRREGFLQCPTLARLPPGVRFSDDGALAGVVRFDPHRDATYRVELVAVSTAAWDDPEVGLVRLEITFVVEGNEPPPGFDRNAFEHEQDEARGVARRALRELGDTWDRWERGELDPRETCDQMGATLRQLRELLERHPKLDGGRWWAHLGGYHMNVHKLLENALFECELYLGHALTFGDPVVRRLAEQNLEGCYQKRLLEAARFLWVDGLAQMTRGEWAAAAETLRLAAAKKDGWGWAVNYGDIWLSEAVARLVHGARLAREGAEGGEAARWIDEAERLLARAVARADEAQVFGREGHPWVTEVEAALAVYRRMQKTDADTTGWLEALESRTAYWCAQVRAGASPFPPRLRPRREDAAALVQRLPRYEN